VKLPERPEDRIVNADEAAWQPYRPTATDPWDVKKVAHLHRRAGFGATRAELHRDLEAGPEMAVGRLLDPPAETAELHEVLSGLRSGVRDAVDRSDRLQAYWMFRLMFDPDPLREKMTLFWHNHFATSNEKVRDERLMLCQNELLRSNALGDFSILLLGLLADPAMLIWLDGADSPKGRPNENFAREFLELFTLGVGNYTEADVREAARALTGWVASPGSRGSAEPRFDPREFDVGVKKFLGSAGRFGPADVVRLTLEHPACASFISRKLYRHFIRDDTEPPAGLIEPLARELRVGGYSIRRIVALILRSRHFYSQAAYRRRIASPVELCVGLPRALGVPRADVRLLPVAQACAAQGQHLFHPPNVGGWAGGRRWITSASVVARTNWLSAVIWGNPEWDMPPFDPLAWVGPNGVPPREVGPALIELLVQGDLSPQTREAALGIARPADADSLRKAAQVLVYCPEYQLN
jgi:uncharacterized protein (DUF1800 family)